MPIKTIVLDTTYILPLFGIKIESLPNFEEISKKIWKNGLKSFEIYLPHTCLIEVMFKLLSEYRKKEDLNILNRYAIAIPSIKSSQKVKIFDPMLSKSAMQLGFVIRHSGHTDMMDCLISASAIVLKAILLTEDKELEQKLKSISETKDLKIWSWRDFLDNI